MQGLTEQLARFVARPGLDHVPEEAMRTVRAGFIDTVATMLAGRDEPVTRIVREHVRAKHSSLAEARLLLGDERAGAADAALVNGVAAHALDYDDVALAGHPSTVLVPAVLAEAEAISASGLAAVRAYLVGYEVWAELIGREADAHHSKGWHPTGVFGTVAAAAAAANLRGLDAQRARHALGIAASLASGLTANFGTMTKPFHAGNGAKNGVTAALLASKGFSASQSVIEEKQGFCNVLSGAAEYELDVEQFGNPWDVVATGINFKPYPSCRGTHCAIDAALALHKEHHFNVDDIASMECIIGPMQSQILLYPRPQTGLQGKFSLEYCAAIALLEGEVRLEHFTDDYVSKPLVQELLSKTTRTIPAGLDEATLQYPQTVIVRLQDGSEYSHQVKYEMSKGTPQHPMPLEELYSKYRKCAGLVLKPEQTEQLFSLISNLESLKDISELMAIAT